MTRLFRFLGVLSRKDFQAFDHALDQIEAAQKSHEKFREEQDSQRSQIRSSIENLDRAVKGVADG